MLPFHAFTVLFFEVTFVVAAILIFFAIAPEKVKITIEAILRLPKG